MPSDVTVTATPLVAKAKAQTVKLRRIQAGNEKTSLYETEGAVGFEGGTVETIMPFGVEHDDFLQRFLERTGPGPHHFTFKVPDLVGAKTVLEDAGYRLPVVRFDIQAV